MSSSTTGAVEVDDDEGPEPEPEPLPRCVSQDTTLTFDEGRIEACLGEMCFANMTLQASGNVTLAEAIHADLDADGQAEVITRGMIDGDDCEPVGTVMVWTQSDVGWALHDAAEMVGESPLYAVDANDDGILDVAAGLDYILGLGDGTLGERPENHHDEERVSRFVDLGPGGVHLFGFFGNHDHGAEPHGSFYTHHLSLIHI